MTADDRSGGAAAFGPEVVVRPIDGAEIVGRLNSLDQQTLSLRDEKGASRSWRIGDLRSLRVGPRPAAVAEVPPVVLLANDDVLRGPIVAADEDTLTLHWTAVDPPQPVAVPLEIVRSFAFQQPQDELDRIRLRRIWALFEPDKDRLISTDNTHVDGRFIEVADDRVRFDTSLGPLFAPVEEVVAVVMNRELISRPESEGAYRLVLFRDGSRISFASLQLADDGNMSGHTVWGGKLAFPFEQAARVQFLGDRVVALTDLTPAAYKFTPYLTQRYPLVANRNVKGGRLRLRGEMYATGLGVSSKSEVTYDLTGGYARFDAVVGIDDMTGGQGNVVFAVELDGRRVYESNPLNGRSPAETVGPLDVSQARQLKLVVDFGQHANIQDVADWCDAVLTKPAEPAKSEPRP